MANVHLAALNITLFYMLLSTDNAIWHQIKFIFVDSAIFLCISQHNMKNEKSIILSTGSSYASLID